VADSIYESILFELQEEYSDLSWESVEDANVDDLLRLVWRKKIDCTIANSSEVNIKRRFYPELQVAFTLEENQELAWNLSPEWEVLSDSIDQWLTTIEDDGTLLVLRDRHYNAEEFDYVDIRTFIRRMKSRLPLLLPLFEKAAEKYGLPWTLLAAQAYQESHWDRRARSSTGVRGMMMLTLTTAKEMGVKSRLNAAQSIMGGAKYLSRLEAGLPDSVQGEDRWWYALAAYNVGMGHLRDARSLADDLDLNPNSWLDLRNVLPLLSQKKYYRDLKYGHARGTEPVNYVRQVRNYQNILRAQLVS
jgi:membrane-bound lytic murein transglycosylase F